MVRLKIGQLTIWSDNKFVRLKIDQIKNWSDYKLVWLQIGQITNWSDYKLVRLQIGQISNWSYYKMVRLQICKIINRLLSTDFMGTALLYNFTFWKTVGNQNFKSTFVRLGPSRSSMTNNKFKINFLVRYPLF